MLKILVADDHQVVREGLKIIIDKMKDMAVVAEACDGSEALTKAARMPLDIVLLDISMPGRNGLETLKQLKVLQPKLKVLVLSQFPEDQYALRVLRAGASGYLTKESAASELLAALRKVAEGKMYISTGLAEKLAWQLQDDAQRRPHDSLSDREFEILRLIGSGKTVSEIGDDLSLSVKTVSTYRARILEKMKMTKTAELILYVLEHGLAAVDRITESPERRPSPVAFKRASR